jgi:hypothetical protein
MIGKQHAVASCFDIIVQEGVALNMCNVCGYLQEFGQYVEQQDPTLRLPYRVQVRYRILQSYRMAEQIGTGSLVVRVFIIAQSKDMSSQVSLWVPDNPFLLNCRITRLAGSLLP